LRTAGSTRVSSSLAILGLIGTSILLVFSSTRLRSRTRRCRSRTNSPTPVPGPTGTLVVQVHTNQNETTGSRIRRTGPSPWGRRVYVTVADNSSNPQIMITDTKGGSLQELASGRYVVRMSDQTLSIRSRSRYSPGTRRSQADHQRDGLPVSTARVGVFPAVGKVRSDMFVELQSSTSVASVNDLVLLQVREGAPGVGYLANATCSRSSRLPRGPSGWSWGPRPRSTRERDVHLTDDLDVFERRHDATDRIAGVSADA